MENNQNNNTTKEKTAENKNHNFLYELGKNIELICNILDDTAANLEEKKQKSLFLSIEWEERDKELKQLMESEDIAGNFFLPEKLNTNKKEQGILRAKQEETENMLVVLHQEIGELEERKHHLTVLLKYLKRQESIAEKEKAARKESKKKKNIIQAEVAQKTGQIFKIQNTETEEETDSLWNNLIWAEENIVKNKFFAPQLISAHSLTHNNTPAQINKEGGEWDTEDKEIQYYTILLSAIDRDIYLQDSGWNIGSAVWSAERWIEQNNLKENWKSTIEVCENKNAEENTTEDVWEDKEIYENGKDKPEEWEKEKIFASIKKQIEKTKEIWEDKEIYENGENETEEWQENGNIENYKKDFNKPNYNANLHFAQKKRGYYFVKMQEDDKKAIAQKLNNNVIKDLNSIIHRLEFIERLVDSDTLRAKLELLTIGNTLKHAINGIQNMIGELETDQVGKLGLKASIVNFAEKLEDIFGMQIQCLLDDYLINDILICDTLYQIIQKICNYIIAYEKSDSIQIKLRYTKDIADLKIQYNTLEKDFVSLWMESKSNSFQNIKELEENSAEPETIEKCDSKETLIQKKQDQTLQYQSEIAIGISKENPKIEESSHKENNDNIDKNINITRDNNLSVIKELILYLSGSIWVGKKEENKVILKVLIPIGQNKMKYQQ